VTAVVCAPLAVERRALSRRGSTLRVRRTGMGPRRAAAAVARLDGADAVIVAGVGGGLVPAVRPGDIVVATEVRGPGGTVPSPSAPLLAGALRELGLSVHTGPLYTSDRLVDRDARRRLAGTGAIAVDMESAAVAAAAGDRPFVAVRAIVDTIDRGLWTPGTIGRGIAALRALRRATPALERWAAAVGPRDLVRGARDIDLVLVVGSADSSHPRRLVEVATRDGIPVHLIENAGQIDLAWLPGVARIALTAGASAPPHLVDEVVECLTGLGPIRTRAMDLAHEDIRFALPKEVS
jgi:4-hydroxy-3-methylbut-2-en-1-yl diphosphate reductase